MSSLLSTRPAARVPADIILFGCHHSNDRWRSCRHTCCRCCCGCFCFWLYLKVMFCYRQRGKEEEEGKAPLWLISTVQRLRRGRGQHEKHYNSRNHVPAFCSMVGGGGWANRFNYTWLVLLSLFVLTRRSRWLGILRHKHGGERSSPSNSDHH